MSLDMLKEKGIEYWPDNDGGLYYVDPETKDTKTVIE